jgi:hypothetical protein
MKGSLAIESEKYQKARAKLLDANLLLRDAKNDFSL